MSNSYVPHLSTRCPACGDNVSMPPCSEPAFAASIERRPGQRFYAVLHLCPNSQCLGGVVATYRSLSDGVLSYDTHQPQWEAYTVSTSVPERPRQMLQSANDARPVPVACAATVVKAVEAMLAEVGYKERKLGLQKRIEKAVADGKLPQLMADLAHDVRQIGNETHTDEDPEPITSQADADRALKFANLLADYLFVLPAEVAKARRSAEEVSKAKAVPASRLRFGLS